MHIILYIFILLHYSFYITFLFPCDLFHAIFVPFLRLTITPHSLFSSIFSCPVTSFSTLFFPALTFTIQVLSRDLPRCHWVTLAVVTQNIKSHASIPLFFTLITCPKRTVYLGSSCTLVFGVTAEKRCVNFMFVCEVAFTPTRRISWALKCVFCLVVCWLVGCCWHSACEENKNGVFLLWFSFYSSFSLSLCIVTFLCTLFYVLSTPINWTPYSTCLLLFLSLVSVKIMCFWYCSL